MLLNLQMHLARSCQMAFFWCLFSTGDVSWYLGAEQLAGYFQLTESMVVTHDDICGNVKERDRKTSLLCAPMLHFSWTGHSCLVWVTLCECRSRRSSSGRRSTRSLLSHKSQRGVDQQEHRAPSQNKVHSIIDNPVALAVTAHEEISLQLKTNSGISKCTPYCVFGGYSGGMC